MSWKQRQPELERLVADGLSASLIGERFGVTRNAVVGRCHRTGLTLKAEITKVPPKAVLTHCRWGHPYDEANTYLAPDGYKQCRICGREGQRRRYWALRSQGASA